MEADLYQVPAEDTTFTRMCGGNLTSENEACVEIAPISGGFILRDTKAGKSRELRFTKSELDAFVTGYAVQHGLVL